MSSLRNLSNTNDDAIMELFKKEDVNFLNENDIVKSSNNKEDNPRRFKNFDFLLDAFTQEELELVQLKVPHIHRILTSVVKIIGYNKDFVIKFVSSFIKNIDADEEHIVSH
jgi:hypothetical protein